MVRLPRNEKQTHRLNSRLQMGPSDLTLALTLTLNSQGQIWNWLYLCQKLSDCHETANISFWTLGLKFDNGFDLGHDLDILIFKVICDLDHLVTKVRCKYLPDSDRGDFSCWRAVDSSSLHMNMFFSARGFTFIAILNSIQWVYSKLYLFYKLEDSRLNQRKHIGVQEVSYNINKDFRCRIWSNIIFNVVFCNRRKYFCNDFSPVFLGQVIACSHCSYLRIQSVVCRWVVAP